MAFKLTIRCVVNRSEPTQHWVEVSRGGVVPGDIVEVSDAHGVVVFEVLIDDDLGASPDIYEMVQAPSAFTIDRMLRN